MKIAAIIDRMDNAAVKKSTEVSVQNSRVEKPQEAVMTKNEIMEQVGKLNKDVLKMNERVVIDYNEKANRIVVKFVDKENNEVVREYPAKEIIRLAEHIHEYLGMLVDESR